MSFDDDKKRKGKERPSKSNPEGWRQDKLKQLKRELDREKHKKDLNELRMKTLKQDIKEMEEDSRPTKDRRQEVAGADEKTSTAGSSDFTKRIEKREEGLRAAKEQGLEQESEDVG